MRSSCAKTIEASLAAMRGVHTAKVNFGGGTANVSYDPNKTDAATLTQRVQTLGYSAIADTPRGSTTRRWQFDVAGMDCGDCAKTIETGLRRLLRLYRSWSWMTRSNPSPITGFSPSAMLYPWRGGAVTQT